MNQKHKSQEMVNVIGAVISGQSRVEVVIELEEERTGVLVRSGYHNQERDELGVGQLRAG